MANKNESNPLGAKRPEDVTLADLFDALPYKNLPPLTLKGRPPAHFKFSPEDSEALSAALAIEQKRD